MDGVGFCCEGFHRGQLHCISLESGSAHRKGDGDGVRDLERFWLLLCHSWPSKWLLSWLVLKLQLEIKSSASEALEHWQDMFRTMMHLPQSIAYNLHTC